MSEMTDGGTFQVGEGPKGEEKEREFCPTLTTSNDLVNKIGFLSVDILNKEKVIAQLWKTTDELSGVINSKDDEVDTLKDSNLNFEKSLSSKENQIIQLESDKEEIRKIKIATEVNFVKVEQKLREEHQSQVNSLEKVISVAAVNQEKVSQELAATRSEILTLKSINKSLNKPSPKIKKKKMNAKPARA